MTASDTAALVALLRAGSRPGSMYADLIEETGSAVGVLEQEHGLLAQQEIDHAAGQIAGWDRLGMRAVTLLDQSYPANLRTVHDRPPLIFVSGRFEPRDNRSLAIVGSRRASSAGLAQTRQLAEHLVTSGYTVVSGLATGIDSAAHSAALASGGRTVAVIGTGLAHSFPPKNAPLQRRIAAKGAVISQFWPDATPTRRSFPMRNAVMSGLTLATVIVEATHTSGARIQARLALKHGRPVLLFEALLEQRWAKDLAARPGVHVVRSPADVSTLVKRLRSPGTLVA